MNLCINKYFRIIYKITYVYIMKIPFILGSYFIDPYKLHFSHITIHSFICNTYVYMSLLQDSTFTAHYD